jgi:hypothetical protein
MKAMEMLRNLPWVKGGGIFGDKIHILLEGGETVRMKMENSLNSSGFTIHSLRRISPSLEDVFITTMEDQGQKNGKE